MYKYIVLDFGNVIAGPSTGHWDMTDKFLELVDINKINHEEFKTIRKKYGDILSERITTLDEEYDMFFRFYSGILNDLNYSNYEIISNKIAYDRTYNNNNNKYTLFDNIHEELSLLKEEYKLLLLTDNWPCVYDYLKEKDLNKYFDKVYVSSIYGVEKKDKTFFDYPINDFNIKEHEALFIDDNETNLDIAKEKDFDVMLMDRMNIIENSKYQIINDLKIRTKKRC